jgi:predicted RNA-binding Zn ribbon-like protein
VTFVSASYDSRMHVNAETLDEEIRVTVDALTELANAVADDDLSGGLPEQLRRVLIDHDFVRANDATVSEMQAFADRCVAMGRLVNTLPDADLAATVAQVNSALESSAIAPSLSAHDGFALHIHWTSPNTPFAHQVAVDLLMALAQTVCDHGVDRFGRCAASDCDHVFYDATKNRSRRFCSDPRCASRTHTAAHRARRASGH